MGYPHFSLSVLNMHCQSIHFEYPKWVMLLSNLLCPFLRSNFTCWLFPCVSSGLHAWQLSGFIFQHTPGEWHPPSLSVYLTLCVFICAVNLIKSAALCDVCQNKEWTPSLSSSLTDRFIKLCRICRSYADNESCSESPWSRPTSFGLEEVLESFREKGRLVFFFTPACVL